MGKRKRTIAAQEDKKPELVGTEVQNRESKSRFKTPWAFALKFLILFAVCLSVIHYTDSQGYFQPGDEKNNHPKRRWNSFYELTEKDTVDIIFLGNSHIFTGIIPEAFSSTLGCYSYILASPTVPVIDMYYSLREAFTRTKPRLVICETYAINNLDTWDVTEGNLSNLYRSFDSRHNLTEKLTSSFFLFGVENQAAAWSHTIRNHEYLYRDTAQIRENMVLNTPENKHKMAMKNKGLNLGRFVRFQTGLSDSTLKLYENGAPCRGEDYVCSEQNVVYLQKLKDLCKEHGVDLMFLTIPMYYKHIDNYQAWHDKMATLVDTANYKWLDLQLHYDTTRFSPKCFENTYGYNQHLTYYGALVCSYKLANYLVDSTAFTFPDRSTDERWISKMYDSDGYFYSQPARKNDPNVALLCKDTVISDLKVRDCLVKKEKGYQTVFLKLQKNNVLKSRGTLKVNLNVDYNGNNINTWLDMIGSTDVDPVKHRLYIANVRQGVVVKGINAIY
ncbi:MAG: hypothetical protein J6Y37_08950 [Paludibacteraceae bacterium]|nr:hypothetical protein [Paludibacteraceae bacterium]